MNKLFFLISFLILSFSTKSYTQSKGISFGVTANTYFHTSKLIDNATTSNTPRYGVSLSYGFNDLKVDPFYLRFFLFMENYSGQFAVFTSGIRSTELNTKVNKTIVGLGVLIMNFNLHKNIRLGLGCSCGLLLTENYHGQYTITEMGSTSLYYFDNRTSGQYNKGEYCGLNTRIGYERSIKNNWLIKPELKFYYGLTPEFNYSIVNFKSFRLGLAIGF